MASDRADLIKQAQKVMQDGQFDRARQIAEQIISHDPQDQDGLYLLAVAARYQGAFDTAKNALDALKQAVPDYGRAYQEEGHLLKGLNQPGKALTAYRQAVLYNPALLASWRARQDLSQQMGYANEATEAHAHLQHLQALPAELLAVLNHIHEGRVLRAEKIVRAFLRKTPHHLEGMRLLADIGTRLGVHEDAEFLLATALELAPENIQIRIDYIQVLRKRQKFHAALEQARMLHMQDPENPVFLSLYAIENLQAGQGQTALSLFDKVLQKLPNDPATLTSYGHALKTYGDTPGAIASYQNAIKAAPLHGDAWYGLANLKTYTFTQADIHAMQSALKTVDLSFMARIYIAFALGKALEDGGRYAQAFEHYQTGNHLKRRQTRYTTEQMQDEFAAQARTCTPALFEAFSGAGCPAPDPIFIVGLPRAGSTLIEQILASHSQVDGTLELPNILALAHQLRGRKQFTDRDHYPRILEALSPEKLQSLGEQYIAETKIHRKGAPFFTDKMPNNFRHLGLIHLILPNAKIIDARRNPMDCCWSGFKQLFAEGQEFTYDLDDIGQYYKGYVDLMQHWQEVLPKGRILRVQHEDVLDDIDHQVHRILEYCGLDFEPACLQFHKTERAVRTASSQQVRQPINRAGQGQWKPYEPYLQPLKLAVGNLV